MFQKDIWLTNLNPTRGREQSGKRPVVVVSGDTMNQNFDVVITCPISSKVKNFASCVLLRKDTRNNLASDSEVITFQIRTVSKDRLFRKIGEVSDGDLRYIKAGIAAVLTY